LTAAATETNRVRVGCLVFSIAYRNPGLLAKSLTTIDHISNGRAQCGIGAGWNEPEYRAFGYAFPDVKTREDQLEEYAEALRLLFDEPYAEFSGTHYSLQHAPNNPRPLQRRLPLWIGGAGEKRTLRTAARFADGWNAPYIAPAEWKRKNEVLDRWCADVGRDGREIARTINVGFYMGADAAGAAREETRFQREWGADPRGFTGFLRGTPSRAVELVNEYREAGVEQLNVAVRSGPYDWDALGALADAIIPAAT
jgi:alkanesulfonate monooxygenase SsuD/methylene tetrahydromethanopterin reductase-like flavin-dependent oxidoreductase (luciferase family)